MALVNGVLAHAVPGDGSTLVGWALQPVLAGIILAGLGWLLAVWRINAGHPRSRVPLRDSAAWFGGLLILLVALQSPIDTFADDSFSVHMVQHMLIAFVAAPLLVLAAPGTLLLRASPPRLRRGILLPILHGRVVRALTFPAFTWAFFAIVMWAAHFTPLFELALESEAIHEAEHLLFLVSALLFWLTAIGRDPVGWRLDLSGRFGYLLLAMPVNSLLGLVIVAQVDVLYARYAVALGDRALDDQRLAGTIMWLGADMLMVVFLGLLVARAVSREKQRMRRRAGSPTTG